MGYLYAYGLPVHIWASPYVYGPTNTVIVGNPYFTHMHMSVHTHNGISNHEHTVTILPRIMAGHLGSFSGWGNSIIYIAKIDTGS